MPLDHFFADDRRDVDRRHAVGGEQRVAEVAQENVPMPQMRGGYVETTPTRIVAAGARSWWATGTSADGAGPAITGAADSARTGGDG